VCAWSAYKDKFEVQYALSVEELPSWPRYTLNMLFCILCEDVSFYFIHKLLHNRYIYPYIHKVHHRYASVVGIGSEYEHPIEYYFGVFIPASLAGILLKKKMHITTAYMFSTLRVF
jgi:sterol desaturase/sphingolipid hydroxylase (fatty acid hydroxylase superfamily)